MLLVQNHLCINQRCNGMKPIIYYLNGLDKLDVPRCSKFCRLLGRSSHHRPNRNSSGYCYRRIGRHPCMSAHRNRVSLSSSWSAGWGPNISTKYMGQREAGVGYACKYAKQIDNKLRENLYYTSVFPYGSPYYLFAVLLINFPTAIAAIPIASL